MGQAQSRKPQSVSANGNATGHSDVVSPPTLDDRLPSKSEGIESLSARQKFLVRQTWDIARNDMERVGFSTFNAIFEQHQDLKQVFQNTWSEGTDKVYDERLLSHGMRVVAIVNQVVENIEDVSKINVILEELGRRHSNYNVTPQMVPVIGIHFLASFKPMLEEESLWTSEIERTWNVIVDHITNIVVIAVKEGIAKNETLMTND